MSTEYLDHQSFQIIGREGLKQMHEAAEAALEGKEPDPKVMWDERREEKASTLDGQYATNIEFDIGTPKYEEDQNFLWHQKVGYYRKETAENDAGWRIDDTEETEEEVVLEKYTDPTSFQWKRIWAKLYSGLGTDVPLWEEERRFRMDTFTEIRARIQIGNMMTGFKLLGKPYVFYVGSKGKGSYAPATHPEDVVTYEASPLKSLFPVHRRDGKPLLDSLGVEIKTYSPEESVAEYSKWLEDKLAKKDKRVTSEIAKMAAALAKYKNLVLICWCRMFTEESPPCHADVIAYKVARTLFNHLNKGRPVETEDGFECRACHQKFTFVGPLYEAKCHYCGSPVVWDKPQPEDTFELEMEETPPLPRVIENVKEPLQGVAFLDEEIRRYHRILKYWDDLHKEAMAHAVQPGAIDLVAHAQAAKFWRDRQSVATHLEELKDQFIVEARCLVQSPLPILSSVQRPLV